RDVGDLDAPARVRVAAESAGAGAWDVDQYRFDRLDGRIPGIANERQKIHTLQTPLVGKKSLQSSKGLVAGDDGAGRPRQLQRLATGRGAEIGHRPAHRNRRVFRHQRRRRILHEEKSLLERAQLGEGGTAGNRDAVARIWRLSDVNS